MSKTVIKIEDIFKRLEETGIKLLQNRFLLYKSLSLLAAVALLSSAGFFAWNNFRGGEEAQAVKI
ncbi:hypothetical protein A2242_02760 [Candidatus Falkowbacteria bacterium RIFOXYA2_FULL_47_9]|uniref:Uncharacterized protein n=1 Tax=Candidatus Falkowbacteria bacterium RIFOXYA2_FULL_47_9 TaxID=1797995 RepID=A0A1F5SLZ6_9BACT|nr:MAG: hypothetical protein A2242_02760 [Candidatus Falkowbacteria bacterium RIFOXYA2_FULL_47_9]